MSNKVEDIDIKNRTYHFFNIIDIKSFDPNNIKIDEKSYKNICIYCIGYVMIEDSKCVKINRVNPLYLIFSKVNRYFVLTNESKEKIKKYEELWSKIRDLIMLITKSSDDHDEKYMKIKFTSDDKLPLNKTIETPSMIIVVRKYYPQVFLDECLYEL